MIKVNRNILLISAVILAASGCQKEPESTTPIVNTHIQLCATNAPTKGLLDNGSFNQTGTKSLVESEEAFAKEGNRIQVYAYANGGYYFSDMIGPDVQGSPAAMGTAGVWPFVNGPQNWTSGTHRFYGWLTKDANSNLGPEDLFGDSFNCVTANKNVTVAAFNTATQKLTIPTTTMSPTAPQFDFMYSNIFTTEPINSPVQLEFSHLFAAISFGVQNGSVNDIYLKKFIVKNLQSSKSATISFSASSPIVEYIDGSNIDIYRSIDYGSNGYKVPAGTPMYDVFNSSATERNFLLIWPQDAVNLANAEIELTYTQGEDDYTALLKFPTTSWNAGQKLHFDVLLTTKQPIKVNYEVIDWYEVNNSVTFE